MSISSVDSSLMSRNFVSASSGESKYVRASRVGAQIEQSASMNRQQAILEAGMAACAAAKTPAEVALEAKKAARQMGFAMQASVSEESRRNLKEIKKRIEEMAKKAAEGKDSADGKDAAGQPQHLPQTDQKSQAVAHAASAPAMEASPVAVSQPSLPAAQVQPAPAAVAAGDSAGASAAQPAAANPSVNMYV